MGRDVHRQDRFGLPCEARIPTDTETPPTVLRPIYEHGLGQRAFIAHLRFKAPNFLVSARDFVALMASTFSKEEGTGAFCSRSVVERSMGEQSGFVRGA